MKFLFLTLYVYISVFLIIYALLYKCIQKENTCLYICILRHYNQTVLKLSAYLSYAVMTGSPSTALEFIRLPSKYVLLLNWGDKSPIIFYRSTLNIIFTKQDSYFFIFFIYHFKQEDLYSVIHSSILQTFIMLFKKERRDQ